MSNIVHSADFLVVGSGIAALSFAIKVAKEYPNKSILLVTKSGKSESNTRYAQGGIAVVTDKVNDSIEKHIEDTLIAGDGLNDKKVVRQVIQNAENRFKELIDWGIKFDENRNHIYNLGREGGHSVSRILHSKDTTGYEIMRGLIKKANTYANINILERQLVLDFLLDKEKKICLGVSVLDIDKEKIWSVYAPFVLLAAGGSGQMYKTTTNPMIATGDGIGMAYRVNLKISDTEFVQFHPTAIYDINNKIDSVFLITEAIRGFGAYLLNTNKERFMKKYDTRLELASRDIISICIEKEMKATGSEYVYIDCRHLANAQLKKNFPNIYNKCQELGLDLSKDLIPVTPAAHYMCGGIDVDINGKTNIENIYASGECTRTGLHGANRLASNSLLEALVYSHFCFKHIKKRLNNDTFDKVETKIKIAYNYNQNISRSNEIKKLKEVMTKYVGIVRTNDGLAYAKKYVDNLIEKEKATEDEINVSVMEYRNLCINAQLVISKSIERKKNIGGFYNLDLVEK